MGLSGARRALDTEPLSGGVSCDVWRVQLVNGSTIVVKRALPKLRVAADWKAPAARAEAEVAWFRFVRSIDPRLAPKVIGEDRTRHMFAMEYLPPETYPVWKAELAGGRIDVGFAAKAGGSLARIHAASAHNDAVAKGFPNYAQFHALRLEPYLLYTAGKHPDIACLIQNLVRKVGGSRIALMHGDVSPKNILCGPDGPLFLDAETACFGDPAFDLAFCLNHLLLKCLWHPEHKGPYLDSYEAFTLSYRNGISWEDVKAVDSRAAALLPALLLARIDGKSPVEYLTAEEDKLLVRTLAKHALASRTQSLAEISDLWRSPSL